MLRPLLVLLALTFHLFAQGAVAPRAVIVFGDSITAGSALPKEHQDQAWIKLVEKNSASPLTMINEGKGGRPTASVREFEEMLCGERKPTCWSSHSA